MSEGFRIVWSEAAFRDFEGILDCAMAAGGAAAARRAHGILMPAIERLSPMPRRCRAIPEPRALGIMDYRERIAGPWRICFRIRSREVVLVAVLDGRRDLAEVLIDRAIRH